MCPVWWVVDSRNRCGDVTDVRLVTGVCDVTGVGGHDRCGGRD